MDLGDEDTSNMHLFEATRIGSMALTEHVMVYLSILH